MTRNSPRRNSPRRKRLSGGCGRDGKPTYAMNKRNHTLNRAGKACAPRKTTPKKGESLKGRIFVPYDLTRERYARQKSHTAVINQMVMCREDLQKAKKYEDNRNLINAYDKAQNDTQRRKILNDYCVFETPKELRSTYSKTIKKRLSDCRKQCKVDQEKLYSTIKRPISSYHKKKDLKECTDYCEANAPFWQHNENIEKAHRQKRKLSSQKL